MMIFSGLTSKPVMMVFSGLVSKLVATVSLGLAWKLVVSFFVKPQNQGGGGFFGLSLKINNNSLMFWVSKSLRWFLHLDLKIKRATVYRLRHKIDGRVTAWETRRDLAASFAWKQVGLGFPSLAQD
jgi:hypothetical protein